MNRIKLILAIGIVFMLLSGLGCTEEGTMHNKDKTQITSTAVENLRCEYLVNPMGIDVIAPRLSWILKSEQRSCVQSAYHILVASSVETLQRNKGDLSNSGKIKSNQSNQVVYKGKPLKSRVRCYWKSAIDRRSSEEPVIQSGQKLVCIHTF